MRHRESDHPCHGWRPALPCTPLFTSLCSQPALLGTLLALHERAGNIDTAAATLKGASDEASLEAMAAFLVRHGRWREVAAVQQRRCAYVRKVRVRAWCHKHA